ncbi:MAG: hypothetical protein NT169_18440 [Chloroflexi bacterium]|nr:hypothetical protein [Chloroflexota bacterium]
MRLRRLLIPLVLVFLAYGLVLALCSNPGLPKDLQSGRFFPYLADRPVGEDGYYMLTVAWNIASGHGIVYNYDEPTTGIQPLGTLIYAGLAWLVQIAGADKWAFIRVVLLFGIANLVLFAHLIGTIARALARDQAALSPLAYALGFAGTLFNFELFRWFTYGLETGIYLTLLALCFLYTLPFTRGQKIGVCQAAGLGILAGLTGLGRIDFGIVFCLLLGLAWLRRQIKLRWTLVSGVIALLIVSPWFLYVHSVTGAWMPSSGTAQGALVTAGSFAERELTMAQAILSHLTPWIFSNAGGYFVLAAFLSLVIGGALVFRAQSVRALLTKIIRQEPWYTSWSLAILPLVLAYPVISWATHFYQRYSAPLLVPLLPLMAIAVGRRLQAGAKAEAAPLRVLYALAGIFFVWAFLSLHVGRIGNPHVVSAGFIQSNFPAPAKVGAFQSGVIGFFNPNVINLDGKVNHRALQYAGRNELHRYLDAEGVNVLVDWPGFIYGKLDKDWLAAKWESCALPISSRSEIVSICLMRVKP